MKIEKIEVLVNEHLDENDLEIAASSAFGGRPAGSSVGVKMRIDGKYYGDYVKLQPPTLTASEVVYVVNSLFRNIVDYLEEEAHET